MGSIFSQSTPTPAPPAPPSSYRDEIGGTEQVPIKNEDGSVTYITRKLPLTEEEQAEKDAYDKLMKDALEEIEKLSAADYEVDDSTKSILQAWSNERSNLIEEGYDKRENTEESRLAQRGLSTSSAADASRRYREKDEQQAFKTLENEKTLMADDIRKQNLSYQQNLYNIAATQDNLDYAKLMESSSAGIASVNATNSYNRASIMDYYNRQANQSATSAGLVGDTANALTNVGTSVFSGSYGSLFNNIF